ncbi:MAG: metalloregulator ArsR/SmtB family transcription factor [Collinsella sp.]|nr:metalloregulator ArsR/SmtB family transcription factor [Collinsella sp.]
MSDLMTVAFICVHNACRSQMAEAFALDLASDAFTPFSAGTDPAKEVDPLAAFVMRDRFGLDLSSQRPKSLFKLDGVDIVITMGCGVECPLLEASHREDWGLEDPSGKGVEQMAHAALEIRRRVLDLRRRVIAGAFDKGRLASNLRVLGDANRLRILELLSDGEEHCACSLLEQLDISQPTLSHHMGALRDAGIVAARKDGRWMRYRVDTELLEILGRLVARP